jgi:adenylosuccinate synthase
MKGDDCVKDIKVVIGANFGDEGKGLMTDYLAFNMRNGIAGGGTCSGDPGRGIVGRFNGGAQAGHTVTSPDGRRHIFGHFCSGAFAGLPGYLSEFFVVNPMLFVKEYEQLERIGNMQGRHDMTNCRKSIPAINTRLYVDKNCMITTPYDMMLNQIAEISRGSRKHGSCGVGFNETITRCLYDEAFALYVRDLTDTDTVRMKLAAVRDEYIGIRLRQLGIGAVPHPYGELLANEGIIERFSADAAYMLGHVEVTGPEILSGFDNIILEGAQGLLLDQNHEYFPHVTRSNTGIKNAAELIRKAGLPDKPGDGEREPPAVGVVYVTRAYMTRHGAGPFPTELPEKPYPGIVDLTNIPNPYQDTLRYGLVDIDALDREIKRDMENAGGLKCDVMLAVTCLDQLDEDVDFINGCGHMRTSVNGFLEALFDKLQIRKGYLSFGPTRETIRLWKRFD